MNHRKNKHPSNKKCRNLPNCQYGNQCWYVHPDALDIDEVQIENHQSSTAIQKLTCKVCGKEFETKHDLMRHKKSEHPSNIICREFIKSNCRRTSQQCWYRHDIFITNQPSTTPVESRYGQPQPTTPLPNPPTFSLNKSQYPSLPIPKSPSVQDFPIHSQNHQPPDQIKTLMEIVKKLNYQMNQQAIRLQIIQNQMMPIQHQSTHPKFQ